MRFTPIKCIYAILHLYENINVMKQNIKQITKDFSKNL